MQVGAIPWAACETNYQKHEQKNDKNWYELWQTFTQSIEISTCPKKDAWVYQIDRAKKKYFTTQLIEELKTTGKKGFQTDVLVSSKTALSSQLIKVGVGVNAEGPEIGRSFHPTPVA